MNVTSTSIPPFTQAIFESFENSIIDSCNSGSTRTKVRGSIYRTRFFRMGRAAFLPIADYLTHNSDIEVRHHGRELKEAWIVLLNDLVDNLNLAGAPKNSHDLSEWAKWARNVSS